MVVMAKGTRSTAASVRVSSHSDVWPCNLVPLSTAKDHPDVTDTIDNFYVYQVLI